jgi:hypothetical protein
MLSLTADNASSNDTLTTELAKRVESFSGTLNRTRCFLHIVNLVAKSIIQQFDVPKNAQASLSNDDEAPDAIDIPQNDDDEEEELLQELAKGTKNDDEHTIAEQGKGNPEDADIDNIDGWVDEIANLTVHERAELHKSLRPVKLVLVKVSSPNYSRSRCLLSTCYVSFANSHSRLFTHPQSYCLPGRHYLESLG